MTHIDIDAMLAAANPLTDRTAAMLPLHGAETDLVEQIVATPVGPRSPLAPARVLHRRRLALLLAVTAAVAAVLAVLPSGHHDGGPAPAFAAPLVRFANASPLVLLQLPGWHVVYADEAADGYGEMHFVRGAADANGNPRGSSFSSRASLAGRVASFSWMPANLRGNVTGGHQSLATGLGVTVHRLIYEGGSPRAFDVSALLSYRGRVLEFRATVTDMAMFRAELRALHQVDTTTWLRAMPPSVVKTADSGETIRQMLKGIPLPRGFDAARIRGARLLHDRYQLGAAVTGTVACMWIADWNRARAVGDTQIVERAIAAMATAPRWPILREMAQQGAWPQVLISYAKAMHTGRVQLDRGAPGQPLTAAANSGLGCGYSWGISLGSAPKP
ncbi:MAG TPA: hypothetical protein VGI76_05535 [Solirubrobacteraceae bacterium]|jgi:hypothetical protein